MVWHFASDVICFVSNYNYTVHLWEILFQYTYRLLRGVIFEILSLSNYAFSIMMLSLMETFSELVTTTFYGCLEYPEIYISLRHTSLLGTATSRLEPNQGN